MAKDKDAYTPIPGTFMSSKRNLGSGAHILLAREKATGKEWVLVGGWRTVKGQKRAIRGFRVSTEELGKLLNLKPEEKEDETRHADA